MVTRTTGQGLSIRTTVEGLGDIDFSGAPKRIRRNAARAINRTTQKVRTDSAREMRQQVAFPARFLSGRQGRLFIDQKATPDRLESFIRGRFRPTQLSRFLKGSRTPGRKAPRVEVEPGNIQKMERGFLLPLRNGNIGLAIRLRPGERIENKKQMVQISGNIYILYGPSVDQVFRTVADDAALPAARLLEEEFLRLQDVF